ncbi:MAG: substrate-binding domain-containing protein [Thermodesulfovibrionales bacterium]
MTNKADQNLPEIPFNRGDDLHNIEFMEDADLVLFMAGNQFMVMDELISAFRKEYPDIKRIFYETLPPGLELRQILAGGARFGDMTLIGDADIYTSVAEDAMKELLTMEYIKDYAVYLHNRIVLMVPSGNPAGIKVVDDLGRDDVRISQPGAMEDISHHIMHMYEMAGGMSFARRIIEEKRAEGTTILTVVHHRETPLRIMKGTVDVGPVWATEIVNALGEGLDIDVVEPGKVIDQHDHVNYYVTKLSNAPNPQNAELFLKFIRSDKAQNIYKKYGFVPHG